MTTIEPIGLPKYDGIEPNDPQLGELAASASGTSLLAQFISTIQQSDQTDQKDVSGVLPKPDSGSSVVNSFLNAYQAVQQQVIVQILNTWTKEADELVEMRKEDDKKADRKHEELKRDILHQEIVKNYIYNDGHPQNSTSLPLVVAGLVQGQEFRIPLIIDPATGSVSIDPLKDSLVPVGQSVMVASLNSFTGLLPSEIQNELHISMAQILADSTMVACYFSIPQAVAMQGTVGVGGKEPVISKACASAYAQTISDFVLRADFDAFVKCAILRNVPLEKVSKDHVQYFVNTLKIMLLANALAALDKVETGGSVIRASDIDALLSGKMVPGIEEGDMRLSLARDIATLLATLPDGGKKLQGLLLGYFDKNPKVETMIDPAKAFLAFADPTYFREVALSQRG